MKKFFSLKKLRKTHYDDDDMLESEDEYVELNTDVGYESSGNNKVVVRSFNITDFGDIKEILDALRLGNTICLCNIRPLKEKDLVELKRAINKLKKTCEAIDGDIAGFGDDYLVVTPNFATIYRPGGEEDMLE